MPPIDPELEESLNEFRQQGRKLEYVPLKSFKVTATSPAGKLDAEGLYITRATQKLTDHSTGAGGFSSQQAEFTFYTAIKLAAALRDRGFVFSGIQFVPETKLVPAIIGLHSYEKGLSFIAGVGLHIRATDLKYEETEYDSRLSHKQCIALLLDRAEAEIVVGEGEVFIRGQAGQKVAAQLKNAGFQFHGVASLPSLPVRAA